VNHGNFIVFIGHYRDETSRFEFIPGKEQTKQSVVCFLRVQDNHRVIASFVHPTVSKGSTWNRSFPCFLLEL